MNRIKELREECGWTQSELATRLQVAAGTVGLYEQGRRSPSVKVLNLMSNIFDAHIEYILGNSPIRMRPSQMKVTHIKTIPHLDATHIEDRLLESALQDDTGKEMLKQLIKEKLIEIDFHQADLSTVKSIGKMMVSIKDEEIKKAKLEIVRDIVELDFTIEQLYTFSSFLKSFKTK